MDTEEVVEELKTKVVISKDVKEKIYDKLFRNICMAMMFLLYFMFLNMGYIKELPEVFENDLRIFSAILIATTVIVIEIAYSRNSYDIALNAVEILVVAIISLFMPYVYFHRGVLFRFLYSISFIYITVYYLIKCVFIYIREFKRHKNDLCDIKEIVENESKDTYLDEVNERKFEEDE